MSYKILFMGTPEFSVPILKKLYLEHKIIGVITQPPKKKSRGQKLLKSPVHLEAEKSENSGREGEVLTADLIVGCKEKSIKIKLIQKEGKKILKTSNFLTGYKIKKGEILS